MIERLDENDDWLVLNLPPTSAALDTIDMVTELQRRVHYAEGLARVCAAAIQDHDLAIQDLEQALGCLYTYLRALRQGLAGWRIDVLARRPRQGDNPFSAVQLPHAEEE
jgi:hypothetical protein